MSVVNQNKQNKARKGKIKKRKKNRKPEFRITIKSFDSRNTAKSSLHHLRTKGHSDQEL